MFTGIIQAVGAITYVASINPVPGSDDGLRLRIASAGLGLDDVAIGDSIAIQGACMTAIAIDTANGCFDVEISRESLNKTVGLDKIGPVNLEKAVTLQTKLGGHLVTGHVDGLGEVCQFEQVGESWTLQVKVARELGRFFAYKGSATINGVSLTVNQVVDEMAWTTFSINLIPHTIANTSLKFLVVGDQVNVEVDLIARYVERMLTESRRGT